MSNCLLFVTVLRAVTFLLMKAVLKYYILYLLLSILVLLILISSQPNNDNSESDDMIPLLSDFMFDDWFGARSIINPLFSHIKCAIRF